MGLIDFIKDAGAYIFGGGTAVAKEQAKPVTVDLLHQQIDALGIPVDDLEVVFTDPVATVRGDVESQADREKIVLAIGNTPGVGRVDDQLTVLAVTDDEGEVEEEEEAEVVAVMYTVKKGDTLSAIAKAHYGSANKYPVIFEANKPMLKDPDKIYPGQVLRIPPAA
jgi:nucleoid-associated protein YgaU